MNCLRCGRTIADDATFCDECLKTVRLPLQTSEFLSDRIILPVRTEAERPEPARAPEKKKPKKTEKQPKKRPKGLIRAVVLLSLLCALLLGAGGYAASRYSDWLAEKNRVRVQQEEFDRLSARLAEAQSALTDEQERSRSLWQEVQTREDEIEETLMLGTRLCEGVDLEKWAQTFGFRLEERYLQTLKRFERAGLARIANGRLQLTERGMEVQDAIVVALLE